MPIIVVADDQAQVRKVVKLLLSRHEFTVLEAEDGLDALASIRQLGGNISAFMSDISMPDLDGASLSGKIKETFPSIPIVLMSGIDVNPEHCKVNGSLATHLDWPQLLLQSSVDKRSTCRYPIHLPLHFQIIKNCLVTCSGTGKLLDISSKGIAFTCDQFFNPGMSIQLCISWPVLLHGQTPIMLVAKDKVVRRDVQVTAVKISQYEFHTQKKD